MQEAFILPYVCGTGEGRQYLSTPGVSALSQVKKIVLEWRSNIPQITAKRGLTIIGSGGLWDPQDSQVPPGLLDVRLPLSPFPGPAGAAAGGKLQTYRQPAPYTNMHTQRADSAATNRLTQIGVQYLYRHHAGMNMDNTNGPILFLLSD